MILYITRFYRRIQVNFRVFRKFWGVPVVLPRIETKAAVKKRYIVGPLSRFIPPIGSV